MRKLDDMNTEFNSLSSLPSFNSMMNTEFNNAIESNQMKKMIEDEIRKSVMEKYETSY